MNEHLGEAPGEPDQDAADSGTDNHPATPDQEPTAPEATSADSDDGAPAVAEQASAEDRAAAEAPEGDANEDTASPAPAMAPAEAESQPPADPAASAREAGSNAEASPEAANGTAEEEVIAAAAGVDAAAAEEPDVTSQSASAEETDAAAEEQTPASEETKESAQPSMPAPLREAWDAIVSAHAEQFPIEGKIIGWNRGGFHVTINGVGAFCPRSLVALGNPGAPSRYMDQMLAFHVLELDEASRRVVLTRQKALERERAAAKEAIEAKLEPGAVLEGVVDSLSDFGAFVDLGGGVRGLVHVSELSRSRVENPGEVVHRGQQVEVKVLKVERGGKRISLSMKELEPDPWHDLGDEYQRGAKVEGTVSRHTDFGLFVAVAEGVEGLLHTSRLPVGTEIGATELAVGQTIEAWVQEMNADRHRLSLSMREIPEGDPWDGVEKRFSEGQVLEGLIEQVSNHGYFVELSPGLTGLLPFSEVPAQQGRKREKVYRPGQKVRLQIMELDPQRRRISLGREGSTVEGTAADLRSYRKKQQQGSGLNAMAAAFAKLQDSDEA